MQSSSNTSIPLHDIHDNANARSIDICGWTINAKTNPIVTASEADILHKSLGIPLPEMTFGNNSLELIHLKSGWRYVFDTHEALRGVKNGELGPGDGGVKVGYADKWLQSRTQVGSELPMPKTVATKPYDWTYTTTYSGHSSFIDNPELPVFVASDPMNRSHRIPLEELTRPDPILFYAEIPLYEDELHDNGSSHLLVRVRVMPGCIFILSRFTLRVDNVLFRTFDTRWYHSFGSSPPIIVRETSGWEAPYDHVKRFLPKKDDLMPLTDSNFIAHTLAALPKNLTQVTGSQTGWRALGTTLEVLHLPNN